VSYVNGEQINQGRLSGIFDQMNMDHRTRQIDIYIQDEMQKHHIPGLSLGIIQDDTPLLMKGYGLANVELSVPATKDTVYEIASITKLFTATMVMMFVQDGQIALDDPISTYLPNLPGAWSGITIRHILAHQSGIHSYTNTEKYWQKTRLDISRAEILELVSGLPLDFQPGERQAYDNTGYYLLGFLIEEISGKPYNICLKERIFDPLGMNRTRANDPYEIVAKRAAGYTYRDDQLKNAEYYSTAGTFSGGILLSTVSDLAKWAGTLYTDTLLNQTNRGLMWTPHKSATANEDENGFVLGLGWFLVNHHGRRFAGHNGNIVGFSSSLTHFLDSHLTVITLCNLDTLEMPPEINLGVEAFYRE
jgi:D-alanyl-D-alanine carboxypeptidase